MNAENDGASRRVTYIYTPFAAEADKVPTKDGPVESLIPHVAGLFHAIDALEEPPHPVLLTWLLETRGLLHEHGFIRW